MIKETMFPKKYGI